MAMPNKSYAYLSQTFVKWIRMVKIGNTLEVSLWLVT